MHRLATTDLWPIVKRLSKKAKRRLAAVGYVSKDSLVRFGSEDVLIVDASEGTIAGGLTSAKCLKRAYDREARIFSLPGLHTKLMVLDQVAVIGSANLSESGLVEAALITSDAPTVAAARSVIYQLRQQAQEVDEDFLKRILKITVVRRPRGSRRPKKLRLRIGGTTTWLIGVTEVDDGDFASEAVATKAGTEKARKLRRKRTSDVSWVRWTGKGRFRSKAGEGDAVIQIWAPRGWKKPKRVYRTVTILLRQRERKWTRFYLEDPPGAEESALSWAEFRSLLRKAGITDRCGITSERVLSDDDARALMALWRVKP